jgi:hypothetical protein
MSDVVALADAFPNALESLLIRAAVLEGDAGRAAWSKWRRRGDLDAVDLASHRLLPQLYRNLVTLGVEDSLLGRLKGVYRYHWYANQLLLRRGGETIAALEAAGIRTLVLKGAALGALHYGDRGARPMNDLDILVPRDAAPEAMRVLRANGFIPEVEPPEAMLGIRHSENFEDEDGRSVDLHWYALAQPANDDDFWAAAVPVEVGGVPTLALCPADELLYACVHGLCLNPVSPIRWVADALIVIRSAEGRLDWSRLVERGVARRLTVTLGAALEYLRNEFAAPVPVETLAALRSAPSSRVERWAHRALLTPPPNAFRALVIWYDRYRRMRAIDGLEGSPSFLAYAVRVRGLEHAWQVPLEIGRKLVGFRRRRRVREEAVAALSSSRPSG